MLEYKAEEKWCPFVQVVVAKNGDILTNRMDEDLPMAECLGSGCMAWVKEGVKDDDGVIKAAGRCELVNRG